MKGADRFMQRILDVSSVCAPTAMIVGGETVRKKPEM